MVWGEGVTLPSNPLADGEARSARAGKTGKLTVDKLQIHPPMPKNFVFMRVVPLRNWGKGTSRTRSKTGRGWGVTGCAAHDLRFIDTPNADPNLLRKNAIVCEKTEWQPVSATKENLSKIGITNAGYLAEMAKEKIAEKGITLKKNQVKVAMLMCAVSPEFLRDGDLKGKMNNVKIRKWAEGTIKYLRNKYGDNLLSVVIHLDEQNPHASAYLVPMIEKDIKEMGAPRKGMENQPRETTRQWRVSHKDLFTRDKKILEVDPITDEKKLLRIEKGTCSLMQDEYAEALQEIGLDVQRGIRKSEEQRALEYETNKERYRRLNDPVKVVEGLSDEELRQWVMEHAPVVEEVKRARMERDHYQIAAGALQKKTVDLEKEIAESMRDIPVADVIRAITGTDPTPTVDGPKDPTTPPSKPKPPSTQLEFRLPNGQRLGVDPVRNRFENLTQHIPFLGEGAGRRSASGSLNVVMYLTGCSYDTAIIRLATLFGNEAAKRAAAKKIEVEADAAKLRLVTPDDSKWSDLLIKLRAWNINEKAIEINSGIDANGEGHIIFQKQHWDEKNQIVDTGSIVVDPAFPDVNVIETGENGLFLAIERDASHNVICATPTDALVIKSLPEHQNANVIAIGNLPNKNTIKSLENFLNVCPTATFYAENLLAAGRRVSKWLTENFGEQIKMIPLPDGFRHWLDYHLAPLKSILEAKVVPLKVPNQSGPG